MPKQIQWSDNILTGYEPIDHDHRMIWAYINDYLTLEAHQESDIRDAIAKLIKYTKDHFVREEASMEATSYPGINAHRSEHEFRIYHCCPVN